MFWYMLTLFTAMGLCIGSFTNVCIYRIPNKMSLANPPSTCTSCDTRLKWIDLIPVFSWLFLGGKCRYCGSKVSFQYPAVELVTGIAYGIIFYFFTISVTSVMLMIAVPVIITVGTWIYEKIIGKRFITHA